MWWFGLCSYGEAPNILLLYDHRINLINGISSRGDLITFGTHLFNDHYGNKIKQIEEDHSSKSMNGIAREICQQWLSGNGKHPVRWSTLINALKQTQLLVLANCIENSVDESALNKIITLFADSDIILNTAAFLREVYSNQHVIEFDLLGNVGDAPFLDIMMKDLDSDSQIKHWRSFFDQVTLPKKLLITGRPGSGKTTLLRQLAKEWAEGKALQGCEILFFDTYNKGCMMHSCKQYYNTATVPNCYFNWKYASVSSDVKWAK